MSKRRWREYDQEEQDRAYKKATQRGVDYLETEVPLFKPRDGDNCIRWVPPLEDDKVVNHPLGVVLLVHYIEGFGSIVSPKSFGDRATNDPIDNVKREILKIDPELEELIRTGRRVIGHILDLDADDQGEYKIWPAPITLVEEMIYATKNRRLGNTYSLEHPDRGYPVVFDKVGEQRSTKYRSVQLDRDEFPLDDRLLDEIVYLDEIIVRKSEDELQEIADKVLDSVGSGGGRRRGRRRGRDDDDEPRRGRRSARGRERDDDPDDSPPDRSRRGRGRDDEPDDRDRSSRRRGRDDDEEPRRGRGRDDEPDDRGRGDDPEEDTKRRIKEKLREQEDKERGRDSERDDDPDDKGSRRGYSGRGSRSGKDDDEPESRGGRSRRGRSR